MWEEFKKFALKGNVLDLAVGVIIGGAFGKIVTSLVSDIIMPIFGLFMGGVDFSELSYPAGEEGIKYGSFIQSIVDFFIIAFSIFLFIRLINRFKRKEEKVEEQKEEIKADVKEELLVEIRDLLKKQTEGK
ncbi:large conductance mechanosensitive channel protein MscL [Mesobacillus maritimus]|uniref:large conductance mechanosensitive channel protein MscL n=1 Tax=Mesobacillus maritimus TaxID=1643336 RepID=UPI00203F3F99|nr:large conductance mechanosensitive channel protein MscL [Mesobacillus maritimus]MCM3585522.1 large conductance mechanosensitive channel protein MscL [Mesobacillus maritimus]MCM3669782.1 large conductance mechanosensitive channel protein MscL [Mesobacillus maritimus]